VWFPPLDFQLGFLKNAPLEGFRSVVPFSRPHFFDPTGPQLFFTFQGQPPFCKKMGGYFALPFPLTLPFQIFFVVILFFWLTLPFGWAFLNGDRCLWVPPTHVFRSPQWRQSQDDLKRGTRHHPPNTHHLPVFENHPLATSQNF